MRIYLITGFTLRTEAFPPFLGHITIWILYGIRIFLLFVALRVSRQSASPVDSVQRTIPQRFWIWRIAIYTLTATAAEAVMLLVPLAGTVDLVGWYGVAFSGMLILIWVTSLLLSERHQWIN